MVLTQIGVRTAYDKEQDAREAALLEAIAKENENPFQHGAEALLGVVGKLYSDYVYTSGVLLLAWTWWGLYPSYARFRHKHIMRFGRRRQVDFRRWFFYTRHIPKWDKKYLQRVELPRRVPFEEAATLNSRQHVTSPPTASLLTVPREASSAVEMSGKQEGVKNPNDFVSVCLTSGASFAGGARGKLESDVASGIRAINESLQQQLNERRILSRDAVDPDLIQHEVERLVKEARGVIVLKETHATRRAVPVDREVWWVSSDEARRRREWWFWLQVLVVARVMEDLLDMPDMPDFVQ
ncbi:hypothetical protein DQ04_07051020 [Trypanosoma grayi]|uniref:hypothetical protein n=1 Tax=Trypanosoma grayi TaxID=71804 RepID=UPI0004F3FE3F|nr:hypothetical protein DQ04_07051020 [Trypanosoma grayi]KEG08495.1 hypothetical protein DQ04_07051020 [Trypanosoma grayi]